MELLLLTTFLVGLFSSILSGAAGGGGGFIMAPYWLLIGLTPAQGATMGALLALGMGGSSLAAFRGSEHIPQTKRLVVSILVLTLVCSAVGPFFLQHISAEAFKPLLALVSLASLPLLFTKRRLSLFHKQQQQLGFGLLTLLLLANSFIPSSAFTLLITVALTQLFGLTLLQGTVIRRMMGMIQAGIILVVLSSVSVDNFVWQYGLAGLAGSSLGSYFGTRFALKKGERFATYALAASAAMSSLALLLT